MFEEWDSVFSLAVQALLTASKAAKKQIINIMSAGQGAIKDNSQRTVIHTLLASDLPASELSISRLQQEMVGIIGAGIETTKSTLALASFHVLKNPQIRQRLKDELQAAFPDLTKPPTLSELERLPFLNAVIHECKFA